MVVQFFFFSRARCKQTEELTKAVVLFVRNEGTVEQQPKLSSVIKQARELVPLPPKPSFEIGNAEERLLDLEKQIAALSEQELQQRVPKLVTLADRVREFERFLALKKESFAQKKRDQSDPSESDDKKDNLKSSAKVAEMTGEVGPSSARKLDHGFDLCLRFFFFFLTSVILCRSVDSGQDSSRVSFYVVSAGAKYSTIAGAVVELANLDDSEKAKRRSSGWLERRSES